MLHVTYPALTQPTAWRCLHHQSELGIPPGPILPSQGALCISSVGILAKKS